MTIGGAIAKLQNLINADDVPFYYKGGIEKVIETILMELPTIEVSEDCISREWLIKALDNLDWYDFDMFYKVVENAPSVVPSRAEGKWIGDESLAQCSNCGHWGKSIEYYCPNCGAKMKG